MRGDRYHNAPYGLPGDFRIQQHGYEYRSLPSWLQSPEVAFIVLAASKLAILDPTITTTWLAGLVTEQTARERLRGLAKLYKGRDDDAYLLYHILTRNDDSPFTFRYDAHFAPNWGITLTSELVPEEQSLILPACIQPHPNEIVEMREHLLFGIPLVFQRYAPTFVSTLPEAGNYQWLPTRIPPGRRSGYGDLIHNLVQHPCVELYWEYTNSENFRIVGFLPTLWSSSDKDWLRRYCPSIQIEENRDSNSTTLVIPKHLCQTGTVTGLRAILLKTGLFPLWTVETVQKDSIHEWLRARKELAPKKPTWRTY